MIDTIPIQSLTKANLSKIIKQIHIFGNIYEKLWRKHLDLYCCRGYNVSCFRFKLARFCVMQASNWFYDKTVEFKKFKIKVNAVNFIILFYKHNTISNIIAIILYKIWILGNLFRSICIRSLLSGKNFLRWLCVKIYDSFSDHWYLKKFKIYL